MAWPNKNKDMLYRRVGNSGLHVSAIGLGGWLTYGGHVGNETTFDCMKAAYDHGINFFDTAENYSAGKAEVVMGEAIKKFGWSRSDLVLTTKLNYGAVNGEILVNNHGLSRKHIIEGLTASLKRMQLDYVDIVYAHRPDRLTPMEETVRAFNYVIEKGMAFYWGTSMWSADEISEACGIARSLGLIAPIVEQPLYNIIDRQKVEGEYQRIYSRCGIGLTIFSPMKQGLLTGKYNGATEPPPGSRMAESQDGFIVQSRKNYGNELWMENIKKVEKLKPIADKLGFQQGQLAIAWCLKNENVSSIIMGASRPEQVADNVKSLELLPKLTPEIMAEIDEVMGNKPALDPARQG